MRAVANTVAVWWEVGAAWHRDEEEYTGFILRTVHTGCIYKPQYTTEGRIS